MSDILDYHTLLTTLYNLPESYEDASKNENLNNIIKSQVVMERLVEKGIFKDWNEVFILCSEAYQKYRNEIIELIQEYEKEE